MYFKKVRHNVVLCIKHCPVTRASSKGRSDGVGEGISVYFTPKKQSSTFFLGFYHATQLY